MLKRRWYIEISKLQLAAGQWVGTLSRIIGAIGANILPKKIIISVILFGADGRYGREIPIERGNISGWLEWNIAVE